MNKIFISILFTSILMGCGSSTRLEIQNVNKIKSSISVFVPNGAKEICHVKINFEYALNGKTFRVNTKLMLDTNKELKVPVSKEFDGFINRYRSVTLVGIINVNDGGTGYDLDLLYEELNPEDIKH